MKVSIITAVYNGGRTIEATLRSVAMQDYPSIEHIIVDGGSTDNTLALVGSNDARVALTISQRDNGVYDAFNKGLRSATGDVVAFLNSGDTYVSPRVVSTVMEQMTVTGAEAVFADVLIVEPDDETRVVRHYSSKHFSPRTLAYGLMPAHPTLFLRRAVYQSAGEFDTRFRIAGDFEMCLRVFALRSTNYEYLPLPMVRMPRGGLSNSGWRSKWAITREMKMACESNGIGTNYFKLCLRLPLKLLEMI